MKKVLYITNIPSPYRVEFFNELSQYCELTVAFEMGAAKDRDKSWKSAEDYRFRAVFMKAIYKKTEGAFCPEVIRLINDYRKDVIVVGGYSTPTGMYSISYMKLLHIPFLLNCDGGIIKEDSAIKKGIKRFFIGAASGWLSTGKASDQYLIHYGAKLEKIYHYSFTSIKKTEITCVSQEEKKSFRRRLGIVEGRMVLFVGSFIHRKGVDILLKACKNLENTAVVLVGGDNMSPYEEILRDGTKCTIYAVGFKTKEEVKKYYQAADVFVLPTREDIWGLVINEAMAHSLPVITTLKCVAGLELVRDGLNGYLVEPEDYSELNKRIKEVLQDDELRMKMSEKSRERIEWYTIENMTREHVKLFACDKE